MIAELLCEMSFSTQSEAEQASYRLEALRNTDVQPYIVISPFALNNLGHPKRVLKKVMFQYT